MTMKMKLFVLIIMIVLTLASFVGKCNL